MANKNIDKKSFVSTDENGKLIINGEEVYELDEDCLIRGGVKTVG